MRIVLASASRYRARQLALLGLPFECEAADIDETALDGEDPATTSARLAAAKACRVQARHPDALIIGSDQLAARDGMTIGKPGTFEAARAQLQAASGRAVTFFTAVHLAGPDGSAPLKHLDTTVVHFRSLSTAEIDRYLAREQPLDCAGSFKCEGLGISLFEAIETRDPSALIGLPLIALAALLRQRGLAVP